MTRARILDAFSIVCANLVENAIKYGREGGKFTVRIQLAQG
jgi:signal transduction histidine kinase